MQPQALACSVAQPLRGNAFSRQGCVFAGWSAVAGGPAAYRDAQTARNLVDAAGGKTTAST